MNVQEMQLYCRKNKKDINQTVVDTLSPIYCLLDFDKEDFCNLVDAIGLDKWMEKADRWERLARAEAELTAKERYLRCLSRLEDIQREQAELQEYITHYRCTDAVANEITLPGDTVQCR